MKDTKKGERPAFALLLAQIDRIKRLRAALAALELEEKLLLDEMKKNS